MPKSLSHLFANSRNSEENAEEKSNFKALIRRQSTGELQRRTKNENVKVCTI